MEAGGCRISGGAVKTVVMSTEVPRAASWPGHLPVGALRVVRWSARYDQTVSFYQDIVGLPVLETFHRSYGLDGTIFGMPGGGVHLEIVRLPDARRPAPGLDQLPAPRCEGPRDVGPGPNTKRRPWAKMSAPPM